VQNLAKLVAALGMTRLVSQPEERKKSRTAKASYQKMPLKHSSAKAPRQKRVVAHFSGGNVKIVKFFRCNGESKTT